MTQNTSRPEICLVTGVAGFIGSHLAESLVAHGYRVIGVDALLNFYSSTIKQGNLTKLCQESAFQFIQADLREIDLDELLSGVDYIFHLAAQPGVRTSWGDGFSPYVEHNILATQRLLEAAKRNHISRIVYASSSSVYGNTPDLPARENSLLLPLSPYGVTKLAGEHLCRLYSLEHGLPTISLRYFSVYGPRQRPDMAFHKFIRAFLLDEAVTIYGDGEQSRDFTYVDDIVAANIAAMHGGVPGHSYNVGGGVHVTVNEVLALLKTITGKQGRVSYQSRQLGDAAHTLADTTAAREELNFTPTIPLSDGLYQQVKWMEKLLLAAEVS